MTYKEGYVQTKLQKYWNIAELENTEWNDQYNQVIKNGSNWNDLLQSNAYDCLTSDKRVGERESEWEREYL